MTFLRQLHQSGLISVISVICSSINVLGSPPTSADGNAFICTFRLARRRQEAMVMVKDIDRFLDSFITVVIASIPIFLVAVSLLVQRI